MSEASPGYANTPAGSQVPSICRLVVYHHPEKALLSQAPIDSPAVVQGVNTDGTVNLFVMSQKNGIFFVKNVPFGEWRGQWSWPPRV